MLRYLSNKWLFNLTVWCHSQKFTLGLNSRNTEFRGTLHQWTAITKKSTFLAVMSYSPKRPLWCFSSSEPSHLNTLTTAWALRTLTGVARPPEEAAGHTQLSPTIPQQRHTKCHGALPAPAFYRHRSRARTRHWCALWLVRAANPRTSPKGEVVRDELLRR